MIIANQFTVKSLGECVPGELVRVISHDRNVFALVLANAADNRIHIGLLNPVDNSGRLVNFLSNTNRIVLSFGTGWFLKPLRGDAVTRPGQNVALHHSGRLTISRDGYCIRFSEMPNDPYGDDAIFNLTQSTVVDTQGQDPMPFRGFAIWESQAAFEREDDHLLEVVIEAEA
ncbi:MAG: hypothetical protein E5X76_20195 [Mesorhizobium sp.]|nr:MAG: hypothetical protein E5X76_20195 [Mesorhizobium sp.]